MIRSVKHYLNYSNSNKLNIISNLLDQYKLVTQFYINYIWNNKFNTNNYIFDIQNDILDFLPKFINYNNININFKHNLSARLLTSAITQAIGIVKGCVAERRKLQYIIKKRKEENKPTEYYEKKLLKNSISKPILNNNFKAELSSKNISFIDKKNCFDFWIKLSSTGFGILHIPAKLNKLDKKFINKSAKRLSGILLDKKSITIRYEIKDPEKKHVGKIVGADTGLKTVITLSDSQFTPKTDKYNHSLESICQKLSKKTKGSKNYKQSQDHRLNFINWSINQLNLSSIKQINLEEIVNIFYKNKTSKLLSTWTNSLIEEKLKKYAEEQGVLVKLQTSTYRSQRCSSCGIVHKSNRIGKIYKCNNCKIEIDSDLNGAKNHEISLPKIPYEICQLKKNISGFFWREEGIFELTGEEFRVPHTEIS